MRRKSELKWQIDTVDEAMGGWVAEWQTGRVGMLRDCVPLRVSCYELFRALLAGRLDIASMGTPCVWKLVDTRVLFSCVWRTPRPHLLLQKKIGVRFGRSRCRVCVCVVVVVVVVVVFTL